MELTGANLRLRLAERLMRWRCKAGTSEWHNLEDGLPSGHLMREDRDKPRLPVWRPDENLQQAHECVAKLEERFPVDFVIDNYSVNMWRRRVDPTDAPAVSRPYNSDLSRHAAATALCQCIAALEEMGKGAEPLKTERPVKRAQCADAENRHAINQKRAQHLQNTYDRPWTFKKPKKQ